MNQDEWIAKAKKLLKAIRFNYQHPSSDREIIGGNEIQLIEELLT